MHIADIIREVGEESSYTNKVEILKRYRDFPLLAKVLRYAYDPDIKFGMANPPYPTLPVEGEEELSEKDFSLLDDLASRKLTGNAAKSAVSERMEKLTRKSSTVLGLIIRKDLICGIHKATVQKVFTDLLNTFSCQLADKFDEGIFESFVGNKYVSPKLDGMRCLIVKNGDVRILSRNGKDIPSCDWMKEKLSRLMEDKTIYDGELIHADFYNSMSVLKNKSGKQALEARFHLFDHLTWDEFYGYTDTPLSVRLSTIETYEPYYPNFINPVSHVLVNDLDEVFSYNATYMNMGYEGTIVKLDAPYRQKRTKEWMKIKEIQSEDLRITGYFEGTGRLAGMLGGFVVEREGQFIRVGSGLSDGFRAAAWVSPDSFIGVTVEIQYQEVTPDGSLRHPRFMRIREDK